MFIYNLLWKKQKLFVFIVFIIIFLFLSVFVTLQSDVFSYHIWTYTAIKEKIQNIYDQSKYFDKIVDYPPLGVYIAIFQGKILSLFSPLRSGFVSALYFYKILPFFFIVVSLYYSLIYLREKKNVIYSVILLSLFAFSTIINGQFDIVLLVFLLLGLIFLSNKNNFWGLFFILLPVFIKQTGIFFSGFILLNYLVESKNKTKFFIQAFFLFICLFIFFFIPFIIHGSIKESLNGFLYSTFLSDILSGNSFGLLSIIKNGYYISYNYKIGLFSLKTYSAIMLIILVLFLTFRVKRSLLTKTMLFSIIWYNITVSIREQHILYILSFVIIYLIMSEGKLIYSIPFIVLSLICLFVNNLTSQLMFLFGIPKVPYIVIQIFTIIQVTYSIAFIFYVIKREEKNNGFTAVSAKIPLFFAALIFFVTVGAIIIPGRFDKNEKNFLAEMIIEKRLTDYSKDKYIDLSVISISNAENYLGVRLSNEAFFKTKQITDSESIIFDAGTEFAHNGLIICNKDTFEINECRKNLKVNFNENNEITVTGLVNKKYANILFYNVRYFTKDDSI